MKMNKAAFLFAIVLSPFGFADDGLMVTASREIVIQPDQVMTSVLKTTPKCHIETKAIGFERKIQKGSQFMLRPKMNEAEKLKLTKDLLITTILEEIESIGIHVMESQKQEIRALKDINAIIKYFDSSGIKLGTKETLSIYQLVSELRSIKTNSVSQLICTSREKFDFNQVIIALLEFGDIKPITDL